MAQKADESLPTNLSKAQNAGTKDMLATNQLSASTGRIFKPLLFAVGQALKVDQTWLTIDQVGKGAKARTSLGEEFQIDYFGNFSAQYRCIACIVICQQLA